VSLGASLVLLELILRFFTGDWFSLKRSFGSALYKSSSSSWDWFSVAATPRFPPTKRESSGLSVFLKKLRILALGFACFLAKKLDAAFVGFLGVLEDRDFVDATIVVG
jgi:hypothetical protein